jgi:hypothetical protein
MERKEPRPDPLPTDPNWVPAQQYASSLKMVEDLQAHQWNNKVLLDGGDVVQFSLCPPPVLNYYTQADWSVGQQYTAGQPTGSSPATTQGMEAGVLPFGGHVYTGVPPYPSMKGDDLYQLKLTVPADWPAGPNMNTVSIGEHGASGGPQQRNVKIKDETGTVLYETIGTYPSIPYCVGGPPGAGVIVLTPGKTYNIEIFNNGPKPENATYPPVTDMVVYCYAPQK